MGSAYDLFRGSVGSGVAMAAEAGVDSFFGPYPAGKLIELASTFVPLHSCYEPQELFTNLCCFVF